MLAKGRFAFRFELNHVSLLLTGVTDRQNVTCSSGEVCDHVMAQLSLTNMGRQQVQQVQQVCPGEIVTYRCTTNGSVLAWALPPLMDSSDAILFDSDSPSEIVRSRVQGEVTVLAVLVTGAPAFESFLTIKPRDNMFPFNVTCICGGIPQILAYSIASKSS